MNIKQERLGLSALGARTAPPPISWLMSQALSRPGLISLAAGFTDSPSLPVLAVREILKEMLLDRPESRSALQYGSTQGDPDLIRLTSRRLHQQDASALRLQSGHGRSELSKAIYDPDRMLITHGSQQMLYLLTEILCDPGDIILVEDPTYFVFLSIAQSHGLQCRGIPMHSQGLDPAQLDRVLRELQQSGDLPRVKLVYQISYHQNPTGITASYQTKESILQVLRSYEFKAGHPIYLVEDAAYRDLRYAGEDVPSTLTLPGAAKRVIYTGTYSKPFATGVRVGYGLLPPGIISAAGHVKGNHDFGTAHLLQKILAFALDSGRFDSHLHRLRKRYRHKASVMEASLLASGTGLFEWKKPSGGLYFWAKRSGAHGTGPRSRLFRAALKSGVLYVPGCLCFASDDSRAISDRFLRLSFGNATELEIEKGIERLVRAVRKAS